MFNKDMNRNRFDRHYAELEMEDDLRMSEACMMVSRGYLSKKALRAMLVDQKPTIEELELSASIARTKPKSYNIYVGIERADWNAAMDWADDNNLYLYPIALQGFALRNRNKKDRQLALQFKLMFG